VECERQPAREEATTDARTGIDGLANRDNNTKQEGSVAADLHGGQATKTCSLCGHSQEKTTADGMERYALYMILDDASIVCSVLTEIAHRHQ
jgi:hypothetical protein